jgi:hypothetical protein
MNITVICYCEGGSSAFHRYVSELLRGNVVSHSKRQSSCCYSRIAWGTEKAKGNLSQDSRSVYLDLNSGHLEYKARMLLTRPRCSIPALLWSSPQYPSVRVIEVMQWCCFESPIRRMKISSNIRQNRIMILISTLMRFLFEPVPPLVFNQLCAASSGLFWMYAEESHWNGSLCSKLRKMNVCVLQEKRVSSLTYP